MAESKKFKGRVWKTTDGGVKQAWLVVREDPREAMLVVLWSGMGSIGNAEIVAGRQWVDRRYNDDEQAEITGTAYSDGQRDYIVVPT
ncbi:hypothetical protein LLH23_19045 [bacterium]|nr:hypothetical protein [bacterium]